MSGLPVILIENPDPRTAVGLPVKPRFPLLTANPDPKTTSTPPPTSKLPLLTLALSDLDEENVLVNDVPVVSPPPPVPVTTLNAEILIAPPVIFVYPQGVLEL